MMFAPTTIAAAAATTTELGREFIFGHPAWLWGLLLLPPLLLLRRRRGTAAGILHPTLRFVSEQLRRPATLAGRLGPICLSLALAALLLAMARPQWKDTYEEQKVSGIDIMLVCDLSGSMAAPDMVFNVRDKRNRPVRTAVDRLTAARHVLKEFISGRPNDRIGLVAFAGRAKLCSPLTLDHGIVRYVLDQFYLAEPGGFGRQARPGYIEQDGTAIGSAIASAATRLNERRETKSKVIILVTDGVNNSGTIAPIEAAKQSAELGIKIFTIAIGRDERISRHTAQVSAFDEETLKEIADLTGGRFYRASSGTGLLRAFADIDKLEKTEVKRRTLQSYEELFPWPLAAACILLGLGCLLTFTRPRPAP